MHFSNPCSRAKGFVLSPLPELGTMGSKWGGARVTDSSTSSRIWVVPDIQPIKCLSKQNVIIKKCAL
jgi:hypothetical protein